MQGTPIVDMLLAQLVGITIGSLIGAVILRAAFKWVQKSDIPYGKAYSTMFFGGLAEAVVGLVVGLLVVASVPPEIAGVVAGLILIPISFLILAGFTRMIFGIPFQRACLVTLAAYAISLAIALCIGAFAFVLIMLTA